MPPTASSTASIRLAIDPLWQCLCPAWPLVTTLKPLGTLTSSTRTSRPCPLPQSQRRTYQCLSQPTPRTRPPFRAQYGHELQRRHIIHTKKDNLFPEAVNPWATAETRYLNSHLRALAIDGKVRQCRELAEYIVRERKEPPSAQLYTALILSNISHEQGAAWRVSELLEEMHAASIPLDVGVCHAVLKALAVHPDHLLRSDILEYMRARWLDLSEEGAHDVAAGLLREGLMEQASERMQLMRQEGMRVEAWLLDMAVYALCAVGEVEEAHRIIRQRHDSGELTISRAVWHALIDCASAHRHHPSTALTWNSQVNTGYIQLPSGTCLNVLSTAAHAGDAVLATDVFTHLSRRGTTLRLIHYQQLVDCYLSTTPPDLQRAISILPIMTLENIEPTAAETRSLYKVLLDQPGLLPEALDTLRDLHQQGRKIPIAALNLLIECHVELRDLDEAMKIYKLIHTFVPISEGSGKTFANIETFNLLLRGCRLTNPPNEHLASFLVSELLALQIPPTALTYDRLILIFIAAARHALMPTYHEATDSAGGSDTQGQRHRGLELLEWSFRHFADMQNIPSVDNLESADESESSTAQSKNRPAGLMLRLGTIEQLALELARVGDERCWDVLQAGEDHGDDGVEGWSAKGRWVRRNVEEAWEGARGALSDEVESSPSRVRAESDADAVATA